MKKKLMKLISIFLSTSFMQGGGSKTARGKGLEISGNSNLEQHYFDGMYSSDEIMAYPFADNYSAQSYSEKSDGGLVSSLQEKPWVPAVIVGTLGIGGLTYYVIKTRTEKLKMVECDSLGSNKSSDSKKGSAPASSSHWVYPNATVQTKWIYKKQIGNIMVGVCEGASEKDLNKSDEASQGADNGLLAAGGGQAHALASISCGYDSSTYKDHAKLKASLPIKETGCLMGEGPGNSRIAHSVAPSFNTRKTNLKLNTADEHRVSNLKNEYDVSLYNNSNEPNFDTYKEFFTDYMNDMIATYKNAMADSDKAGITTLHLVLVGNAIFGGSTPMSAYACAKAISQLKGKLKNLKKICLFIHPNYNSWTLGGAKMKATNIAEKIFTNVLGKNEL